MNREPPGLPRTAAERGVMKRSLILAGLWLLLLLPAVALAQAESDALVLRLSRDFGGALGASIQGRFSYRVTGPADLVRVEFLMDGAVIAADSAPPFAFRFDTADFSLGTHRLSARGYTADGRLLQSNAITRQFVPAWRVYVLTGVVVLLVVVVQVVTYLTTRPGKGPGRDYGLLGGVVCPYCGHPARIRWWNLTLVAGRLLRCPHCRRWHFSRRATPAMLASAEAFAAELAAEAAAAQPEAEAAGQRSLDESRYER